MATVDRLNVILAADTGPFNKGMRDATGKVRGFGVDVKKVAGILVTSFAVRGLARVGKELFDLGAEAVATQSRFNTVFGPQGAALLRGWNREFSRISALSQQQFEDMAARTGAIAQGMGFATDASASLAQQIVALGADLASFNDQDTVETVGAINTALVGERERLKQLGIVLLEADVQQRALADTGKTVAKSLTQQEKATATLALITEKAGVAVGDAVRTQNDMDRVVRLTAAAWIDLKTSIGVFLATSPLIRDALTKITAAFRFLVEVLQGTGEQMRQLAGASGLVIGAALGVGILRGLEAVLREANLPKQFSRLLGELAEQGGPLGEVANILSKAFGGFGNALEFVNIPLRAVAAGADLANDSLQTSRTILNGIIADIRAGGGTFDDFLAALARAQATAAAGLGGGAEVFDPFGALRESLGQLRAETLLIGPDLDSLEADIRGFFTALNAATVEVPGGDALAQLREQYVQLATAVRESGADLELGRDALGELSAVIRKAIEDPAIDVTQIQALADAYNELSEAVANQEFVAGILERGKTATDVFTESMLRLHELVQAGELPWAAYIDAVRILATEFDKASNAADKMESQLEKIRAQLEEAFRPAFRQLGQALAISLSEGFASMANLLRNTFFNVLGTLIDIGLKALAGFVVGNVPGAIAGAASGATSAASSSGAPSFGPFSVRLDLEGVSLFADPAGEAHRAGSQVFIREANRLALEQGGF